MNSLALGEIHRARVDEEKGFGGDEERKRDEELNTEAVSRQMVK